MAHRIAPQAEAEFDNIWYYVAKEVAASKLPTGSLIPSPSVSISLPATRISDDIAMRILRPGLRSFPVGEYVIIYRVEDKDVLIQHCHVSGFARNRTCGTAVG